MKYELSKEIIHADRAWHSFEAERAETAAAAGTPETRTVDIVDVDVMPGGENPVSFSNRDEVRQRYEAFLDDSRLRDAPSEEFIRDRIAGQLVHLDLLEGQAVSVFDHLETAMGSELALVDEGVLDDRQQQIEDRLAEHGLGFDKKYAEDFEARLGVARNKKAMRRHIIRFARRTGLLARDQRPGSSLVVPEIVDVDAGWVGYFGTHPETGEPFAQLNAHPRHGYTRARAAAIAVHEATGHAADFASKARAIRRRQMDPLFGELMPATRENVPSETIALGREQQVLRTMQGRNAWEYHVQADYHDYVEMPWNNALIKINTGDSEDKVVAYMKDRLLPYEKEENIRGRLRDMRDDPMWRANAGAYEPGMRIVRSVMTLPVATQQKFFQEISKYPYNEAQMRAMLDLGKTAVVSLAA